MAQIRNTIELLTKIFRENGTSKIKAETFRLAKFNENDAVGTLWKLLFELIYFCEFGKIDDISIRASSEFSDEELTVYVKTELQKRGYISRELASLPSDMSSGSRELLLALAWLMSKEEIITKFIHTCTSPLEEQDTAYLYAQVDGEKKLPFQLPETKDPVARIKQMLWLNNKLRFNLRSLHAMQREKILLQHKIHKATQGVSLSPEKNHLSMLEVFMLRKPELLKKNLQLLEKDNERLQNLIKWQTQEDIFYKWMDSVLDAKLEDKLRSGGGDAGRTVYNIPQQSVNRLHLARLNLQEAIVKYEAIVDHLDRVWEDKSSEISEEELDTVLSSLDLELSIQKANISLNNTESYVNIQNQLHPYSPKLIFQKKVNNQRAAMNPRGLSSGPMDMSANLDSSQVSGASLQVAASSTASKDVEEEISRLLSIMNQLQEEVDKKQEAFRKEMQSLSTQFRDAINIPPLSRWQQNQVIC